MRHKILAPLTSAGQWLKAERHFAVVNPATGEALASSRGFVARANRGGGRSRVAGCKVPGRRRPRTSVPSS